ncbi:interferon alpha/beta receptor 2-like [Pimephales promelas]|uniref:interferon alpha/beta receptor 2-like n=1 Tax=Pimephales promelas TaxID=90988 RepID=UPI0019555993|nr:interferon alpha/beta receptor 2-like [Pimephales promelas]KAG1929094.1 cytokine receptor family member b2 [Pimephales promelas]
MCTITRTLTAAVLLHMALCMDVPAPVHLLLSSQHFVHLLSWEKGPGSPDGVRFSVRIQTQKLSGTEVVVKECEDVTSPLRCNLTEALSEVEETYYISVSASLGKHTSYSHCRPFQPILNTTLEPPLLSVAACNRSLCVSLRAPAEKLHSVYDSHRLSYRLTVRSADGAEFPVDPKGLGNVTVKDLTPGRRYCVNVSIVGRNTTHRDPVCADIPHTADVSDVVISVVLCLLTLLLLLVCSPRLVYRFFCLTPPLPAALTLIESGNKVLLFTPAELINTLFEDPDSVQKTKISGEEEDEEESVTYERIAAHYLDARGSSLLICPVSASCESSGDVPASLSSSTDAPSPVVSDEPTASPQGTSPLRRWSIALHTHEDDAESATDVNLFSVTLRGVSAEPVETCSVIDELSLYPQSLLLTDPQSHISTGKHISEEEEECSEYLSRN